jgi:hypothetical protein
MKNELPKRTKVAYIQKKSIAIMRSIYRLYKKYNEKIYMAPHQEKLQCENATIRAFFAGGWYKCYH